MSLDKHIRRGHPIVFGLLIFFSIIELSISAWLVAQFRAHHNNSFSSEFDRTAYVVFTSTWTIIFSALFLGWFQLAPDSLLTSVSAHGIFLLLSWILWTAAAAAVTEMLGGGLNCSTKTDFVYCGQLNSMEAFAWIIWILVTLSLFFVIVKGIMAARSGEGAQAALVAY